MSFVIYSRKTGKYLNQFLLQEVDQEPCGWNSICQILILLLWLVTPACFLVKLPQILQKVIVFFPERGGEIKTLFWHIWTAQWLKFFRTTTYFFSILTIFKRESQRGLKVGPKVLTLGPSIFHKNSKLDYTTANVILMKLIKTKFLHESEAFVQIGQHLGEYSMKNDPQ